MQNNHEKKMKNLDLKRIKNSNEHKKKNGRYSIN